MIQEKSAFKVFEYVFGKDWKLQFPIIQLAVRNGKNKINLFDDELFMYNCKDNRSLQLRWNADPSIYRIGNQGVAVLRQGLHRFKIAYHHKWDNMKRYVALRPNNPNEQLQVWRMDKNGKFFADFGTAINQHAGGDNTTGSRGCQTARKRDYPQFIQFIGDAYDIKIPLGIQRTPEKRFLDGIGDIPYILLEQKHLDYILTLPPSYFDSKEDLEYQAKNFVGFPKFQPVIPTPKEALQPDQIAVVLDEINREDEVFPEPFQGNLNAPDATEESETLPPIEQGNDVSNSAESETLPTQQAENITNVDNSNKTLPDNFKPENKEINAPAPAGVIEKTWKSVLGVLLVPTVGKGVLESAKNAMQDGTINLADVLKVMQEIFVFILPFAFWLLVIGLVIWGIKGFLTQISFIVNQYTLARGDMHNVRVLPHQDQTVSSNVPKENGVTGLELNN